MQRLDLSLFLTNVQFYTNLSSSKNKSHHIQNSNTRSFSTSLQTKKSKINNQDFNIPQQIGRYRINNLEQFLNHQTSNIFFYTLSL